MTLTVGSLFSGIGGFDLAAERVGMRSAFLCEIDPSCQRLLGERFPDRPVYADVRSLHGYKLPAVDVLVGGFPCQDLSVAGKRAGLAGERSGLFHEFARLAAEIRPRWICIENVPGLLSSNGGRDMGTVLWVLGKLGYGWAYRCLDAQYFGLAQRRQRVFIVGCLGDSARAASVLFERESCAGDTPPSREAGQGVAYAVKTGSTHAGSPERGDRTLVMGTMVSNGDQHRGFRGGDQAVAAVHSFTNRGIANGASAERLRAGSHGALPMVAHSLSAEGADASEDGTGRGTPLVLFQQNQRDELRTMDVAGALSSQPGMKQQNYLASAMAVRRLTLTECERLQGFPDGWTAGQPDSTRIRQLGNAVAVPVVTWILKRVMEASQ